MTLSPLGLGFSPVFSTLGGLGGVTLLDPWALSNAWKLGIISIRELTCTCCDCLNASMRVKSPPSRLEDPAADTCNHVVVFFSVGKGADRLVEVLEQSEPELLARLAMIREGVPAQATS